MAKVKFAISTSADAYALMMLSELDAIGSNPTEQLPCTIATPSRPPLWMTGRHEIEFISDAEEAVIRGLKDATYHLAWIRAHPNSVMDTARDIEWIHHQRPFRARGEQHFFLIGRADSEEAYQVGKFVHELACNQWHSRHRGY